MRVRFSDCTFDSETHELTRRGRAVHLSPKAFQLLQLLLESRPKAISKTVLCERIWPKTFVAEGSLATLAAEVRSAIGEGGKSPRLVRTVYGFGYAFSGEAAVAGSDAAAVGVRRHCLLQEGREVDLFPGENIVGRDLEAAVRIDDPTVSRHHARLLVDEKGVVLEDLESKNGTFVDGLRVGSRVRLKGRALLKFGSVVLPFRSYSPDQSTESVGPD